MIILIFRNSTHKTLKITHIIIAAPIVRYCKLLLRFHRIYIVTPINAKIISNMTIAFCGLVINFDELYENIQKYKNIKV